MHLFRQFNSFITYLKGSLLNTVPIWTVEPRGGGVAEVALDLCDAVIGRE